MTRRSRMRSAKPGSDSPIAMTTETRMSAGLSMQRLRRRRAQREALQRRADVVDVVDLAAEHAEAAVMAGGVLSEERAGRAPRRGRQPGPCRRHPGGPRAARP